MAKFKLKLSDLNPNTRSRSEFVFLPNGHWDKNKGRRQTRAFAECFHLRVRIPWADFSVLDLGCALGDALAVWHQRYPSAKLYGCDVAETAIGRCRETYGQVAQFFRSSFEEIDGFWDIIYCSNVLEHFEQHVEIAEELLAHCKVLFLLTPFVELKNGSPLYVGAEEDSHHVATLYRNTFDVLKRSGKASRIETVTFSCSDGGWGLTRRQRIRWIIGSLLRNHYIEQEPLQILYAIHNAAWQLPSFLSIRTRPDSARPY